MDRKYFFIPETILGLALLCLIEHLKGGDQTGFVGASPHPYWIVILLTACRYGTVQGVFAGVLAAATYVYFGATSGAVSFVDDVFPHGAYNLPFLFMLVGGVLGEIRTIHKKMYTKLKHRYQATVENLDSLNLEHQAVSNSKQELEKRIALQSTTMVNLFEQLSGIDQSDPEELFRKLPALLNDQLNVTCASVYLIESNELVLKAREGENPQALPDRVQFTEGMMAEVIRTKQLVTIKHMTEKDDFKRFEKLDLIMTAPILLKDEAILGVINIERMPFFDFNTHSVRIFETFAYWISLLADHAIKFRSMKDRNIADEITGAYSYLYFQKRLGYEIARARRFHSPLSLLLFEVQAFNKFTKSERMNLLPVLNLAFTSILREIDIISKYKDDSTFAIMLPGLNSVDAEIALKRLAKEIDKYGVRPFENSEEPLAYRVAFSTVQVSEGSYETLLKTAEERLRTDIGRAITEVYDDIDYLLHLKPPSSLEEDGKKDADNLVNLPINVEDH